MSLKKGFLTAGILFSSILAPGLVELSSPAQAGEDGKGVYVGIGLTTTSPDDVDGQLDDTSTYDNVTGSFDIDDGTGASVSLGYDFGSWRIEGNYHKATFDVDGVTGCVGSTCLTSTQIDGDKEMETQGLMLKGFYDFDNESAWTPYVGLGIGMMEVTSHDFTVTYSGTTGSFVGETEQVTAYQGIIGISYEMSEELDVYSELSYTGTDGWTSKGGSDTIAIKYDGVEAWGGLIGLRYKF